MEGKLDKKVIAEHLTQRDVNRFITQFENHPRFRKLIKDYLLAGRGLKYLKDDLNELISSGEVIR